MNAAEVLRIVDSMHRDKNIPKEVIFEGIEAALAAAARKHFESEPGEIVVTIDRKTGQVRARRGNEEIDPEILGRIAAQSAKQIIIQKIREAECEAIFAEFAGLQGSLVLGTIQRFEGGTAIVNLGKTEAILPRAEQIPGESYHIGSRIKALVLDVRKINNRVRIILSRVHPDFVRRLFEQEIPEIADQVIEIRALAREAGYRTKIAVASIDTKVDAVGACVGVRGSRIKNIVDELGGERIDIIRWNEATQVMIANALQPAQITEAFLYPLLGRAIVLVKEDQLSLAIGRRGQNVRLASKLVGWDIEIMTHDELKETIERAVTWFSRIPGITEEKVERLVEEGFLSYDDLSFVEPAELANILEISPDSAEEIIAFAEQAAEKVEQEPRTMASRLAQEETHEHEKPTQQYSEAAPPAPPAAEVPTTSQPDNGQQPEVKEHSDASASNIPDQSGTSASTETSKMTQNAGSQELITEYPSTHSSHDGPDQADQTSVP